MSLTTADGSNYIEGGFTNNIKEGEFGDDAE